MDISDLFKQLNKKQQEAVTATHNNLLVLAGAGSGKTRVLVHRIAWLLSIKNCSPCSIIAVTFTNKTAMEMRHRIKHLVGDINQDDMWIGTFHSLSHRLLRIHYLDANLPQDFHILDNEDQLRLLKRLIQMMNLDEKKWLPHRAVQYINNRKDEGLRPERIKRYGDLIENVWQRIYQEYQKMCDRVGLVDFSELLLRAYELWLNKPHLLHYYRQRFTNILIDEFQDTNFLQYAWICTLVGNNDSNIMIVGDDDQSIYSWRGAKVENIQRFLNDFPNTKTVCLEQNYRSTGNILKAANALISHNGRRVNKRLWTDDIKGEPINLYCAFNEQDEARFVINAIKAYQEKGGAFNQCAVLYRNNTQSRVLEEALLQAGLPYHIYGGTRFFERQEVKDAIAYLRLIANRNDDIAYERVINTPMRGIGDRTLNIVRQTARTRQLTLWQASKTLLREQILTSRQASAIENFLTLLDSLEEDTTKLPLHVQVDQVIKKSGIWYMYEQERKNKSQTRIENLEELITAVRQFEHDEKNENLLPLQAFLSCIALGNVSQVEGYQDSVQLMTLHSAKGLEFPQVFIVGMEEDMFPSKMSLNKDGHLEEERRLAYVGITRAMKKLTISYAKIRRLYGKEVHHQPSRFVNELPFSCIEKVYLKTRVIHSANRAYFSTCPTRKKNDFLLGRRVRHPKFGEGTIVNLENNGENSRLQIAFRDQGIKWLIMAYARLEII